MGADGTGWTNSEVDNVLGGPAGAVHGPWGNDVTEVSKSFAIPSDATQCTVSWRSWAINTRDGEHDKVFIDGQLVWDQAAHYGGCTDGWETGPADFPNAGWGGVCFYDVSKTVPCSGTMSVKFRSDLDQQESDESWAFSDLVIVTGTTGLDCCVDT